MSRDKDDDVTSRRHFFRSGANRFARLIGEVAQRIHDGAAAARQRSSRSEEPYRPTHALLRPPGALEEPSFLNACGRSGACVHACPADAIRPYQGDDAELRDTPHIVPSESPCVVCTDLACMPACPTGALQWLDRDQIQMGIAIFHEETCKRKDDPASCSKCADQCPYGAQAIVATPEGPIEVLSGCVGCGVCEYVCPTKEKSITVRPTWEF